MTHIIYAWELLTMNTTKKEPSTITVRVTPNASSNRIKIDTFYGGEEILRVYVTTLPKSGKANKTVIDLLAKHLGISKSKLTLMRGQKHRNKIFFVEN